MTFFQSCLRGAATFGALIALSTSTLAQSQRPTDDSSDEAGLWYAVDKIENSVKTSGLRITDPKLVDYAQRVTCAVTGEDCQHLRLYIIDAPYFNASMYPNGMMLLNSGLLLRAENEAQLSCVIGHEYGHFAQEHTLQQWRRTKNIANASIVLQIVGGAAGVGNEASIGTALGGFLAQSSFSRQHESEADKIGFQQAAAAGYKSSECSDVWTNIISETENSSFKKIRKRAKKTSAILSTHPVPAARAKTLEAFAQATPGGDKLGVDTHKEATAPYFGRWLKTELLAKDYDRHIHLFEELKARGRDAAYLDYYIGEAYRLRRKDGDKERAFTSWEASSMAPNPPPQVWRALGEQYRKKKMKDKALSAYQKYLRLQPHASDQALIQGYITRLSQ